MEEVEKKNLGQLLHDKRVSKINKAYAIYRLDPNEYTLNDLLQEVIKLANKKLRVAAAEVGDVSMEDGDDFAQKAVLAVWENLKAFDWAPEMFYAWVMKIIINRRLHLYRDLRRSGRQHVPLTLQDENGEEYDNPVVYSNVGSSTSAQIPEGLDEEEELICYMMLDRRNQKDIADVLDVDVRTIKRKIKSLKDRFAEAKRA